MVAIAIVPPATLFATLAAAMGSFMIPFIARMPKNMSAEQTPRMGFVFFFCMSVVMTLCSAAFAPSLAACCYASVHADLGSSHVTFRESYAFACKRYWSYLALFFLTILIATSPVLVLEAFTAVSALSLKYHPREIGPGLVALIPVGMIVFIGVYVLSIVLTLRISLAFPACVTESLGASAALRRSDLLTRGAKGRIFLVLLVVYAACYAAYLVGFFVVAIWFAFLSAASLTMGGHVPIILTLIMGVLTLLGVLCMMIFFMACAGAGISTALAVIYNDRRRVTDRRSEDMAPMGAPV